MTYFEQGGRSKFEIFQALLRANLKRLKNPNMDVSVLQTYSFIKIRIYKHDQLNRG